MIVLDTNVISEAMRPNPTARVAHWMTAQNRADLFTTAISEAEVFYGIEKLPAGKKRDRLFDVARGIFEIDLEGRILPFDSGAARAFARIAAQRRARGSPMSEADAQIAGIVFSQGARLATRDVSDFHGCEITVIDPWNE
jgi:predicted nucleic acid-binding protein